MRENAEALIGKEHVSVTGGTPAIMTDTGDLSHCLPAVQASIGGGFYGMHHCRDFVMKDEEAAYILPVKLLAGAVVDLLADRAEKLKRVKESFDYPFGQEPAEEYAKRYGVSVPASNRGSQKLPDRSCGDVYKRQEYTLPILPCEREPHVPVEIETDALTYFARMTEQI